LQSADRPTQGVHAHRLALFARPASGVLGDGLIGMGAQLGVERRVLGGRDRAGAARTRAGLEGAGLFFAGDVEFDGRERDPEGAGGFCLGHPPLHRPDDPFAQIG